MILCVYVLIFGLWRGRASRPCAFLGKIRESFFGREGMKGVFHVWSSIYYTYFDIWRLDNNFSPALFLVIYFSGYCPGTCFCSLNWGLQTVCTVYRENAKTTIKLEPANAFLLSKIWDASPSSLACRVSWTAVSPPGEARVPPLSKEILEIIIKENLPVSVNRSDFPRLFLGANDFISQIIFPNLVEDWQFSCSYQSWVTLHSSPPHSPRAKSSRGRRFYGGERGCCLRFCVKSLRTAQDVRGVTAQVLLLSSIQGAFIYFSTSHIFRFYRLFLFLWSLFPIKFVKNVKSLISLSLWMCGRGAAFEKAGKYALSLSECAMCLAREPAHPLARVRKSRVLEALGKPEEALSEVCAHLLLERDRFEAKVCACVPLKAIPPYASHARMYTFICHCPYGTEYLVES